MSEERENKKTENNNTENNNTESKKTENAGKSEKMERERAYEQVLHEYFSGVNVHRYARSEEDIDGMRRELPPWDIMPPQEDF